MAGASSPGSWSRGQRWRQALWFGLPLALIEFAILFVTVTHNEWLAPPTAILIGLSLYLLVSLIAGHQFCTQGRHEGWESGWAGFRVGLVAGTIATLVPAIWLLVALYLYDNTPPPSPHMPTRVIHSPTLAAIITMFSLALLVLLNCAGLLLSALGGRIGGAVALWRASRAQTPESRTVPTLANMANDSERWQTIANDSER